MRRLIMPKKPTQSVSWVQISNNEIEIKTITLSSEKEKQEEEVMEHFKKIYNFNNSNRPIQDFKKLEERDHDFVLKTENENIVVQLTELNDFDWTSQIEQKDLDPDVHKYTTEYNGLLFHINVAEMNQALKKIIEKN